jgi:hypothetical protein
MHEMNCILYIVYKNDVCKPGYVVQCYRNVQRHSQETDLMAASQLVQSFHLKSLGNLRLCPELKVCARRLLRRASWGLKKAQLESLW